MVEQYDTAEKAQKLGKNAGISPGNWNPNGSARVFWHDLIQTAYNRGKLEALMNEVLRDDNAIGIHDPMRELLKPPIVSDLSSNEVAMLVMGIERGRVPREKLWEGVNLERNGVAGSIAGAISNLQGSDDFVTWLCNGINWCENNRSWDAHKAFQSILAKGGIKY